MGLVTPRTCTDVLGRARTRSAGRRSSPLDWRWHCQVPGRDMGIALAHLALCFEAGVVVVVHSERPPPPRQLERADFETRGGAGGAASELLRVEANMFERSVVVEGRVEKEPARFARRADEPHRMDGR